MNTQEFLAYMDSKKVVLADTDVMEHMNFLAQEAMKITSKLNATYHTPEEIQEIFAELTGKPVNKTFSMFPPFYTDCGKNITVGDNVFINSGCKFQDQGGITIGSGSFIGHNVVFATLNHDENPNRRANIFPAPIVLGQKVWVGSNSTILQGVTIGDNAIIAAGAVVCKDVLANTVVGGVPAKVIRKIKEDEE